MQHIALWSFATGALAVCITWAVRPSAQLPNDVQFAPSADARTHLAPCTDSHRPTCKERKRRGLCDSDASFMRLECCATCRADDAGRVSSSVVPAASSSSSSAAAAAASSSAATLGPSDCAYVADEPNALDNAGGIAPVFERIVSNPAYSVHVHSRSPWLIELPSLLTQEDCVGLRRAIGGEDGSRLARSTVVPERGKAAEKVVDYRSSKTAWCGSAECRTHPTHVAVLERLMGMLGLPVGNAEPMQLIEYELGDRYGKHHDWVPQFTLNVVGPRVLTFFLYLSDVADGGETSFDVLNISVRPKMGSALLWSNADEVDYLKRDGRMTHEAVPVIGGTKVAANVWVHPADFIAARKRGCLKNLR